MFAVELDQAGEGGDRRAAFGQVARQPGLELVFEHHEFGAVPVIQGGDVRIDDGCARRLHRGDRLLHRGVDVGLVAHQVAHHADTRAGQAVGLEVRRVRSEEHTSELQSLMRISYAVFCLKKKNTSPDKYYQLHWMNTINHYK